MSVSSSLPVFRPRQDTSSSFATLASAPWLKLHFLFHLNTTLYSLWTELITSQSYTSKSPPEPPHLCSAFLMLFKPVQVYKVTLCKWPESSHQLRDMSQLFLWILSLPAVQRLNSCHSCKFKSVWVDLVHWRKRESAQMNIGFNIKQWGNESVAALRCCTGRHGQTWLRCLRFTERLYVGQKAANDADIDLISKWFIPLKSHQSPSSQVTIQTSLNNVKNPTY